MKRICTAALALVTAGLLTACSATPGPAQSAGSSLSASPPVSDPSLYEAEISPDTADGYRQLNELGQAIYK